MIAESNIVSKSKPVYFEGIFIILIGFLIVGNTTMTDIVFHDQYVKPLHECHPNVTGICEDLRDLHGCEPTDSTSCLGETYWNELARQAIFIGLIMFAIRMGFAWFLQVMRIRKIRMSSLLMALFWGFIGVGFFMFGFLDLFYYWFALESPPETLHWLNGAGFFVEAKTWTGDPTLVEVEDLYLLNLMGLVVIGIFLFLVMHSYSESGLSNRGIS